MRAAGQLAGGSTALGCAPARRRRAVAAAATGGNTDAAAAHAAAAAAASGRDGRREVAVLGGEDFILSQRSGVEEELFKGDVLGLDADVSRIDFRQTSLRSLAHLPAGLRAPPRFLERVAVHYARNALVGQGAMPGPVPLVQGIWGPKGMGKTFTLELCLRDLGVLPVCLSAGELEDEWAGEPGRRLRERYLFAARHTEQTGELTCLVISDLDAGVGKFAFTMNTVNSQNLQGSLMALCDDPLAVSTGQDWGAVKPRTRVPIYITANDLSRLYAPLVREGRMDKFYYEPNREEMQLALEALFAPNLDAAGVSALLDAFPAQPLDFFGAIRSRLMDDAVRGWLAQQGAASAEGLGAALLASNGALLQPDASLEAALAAGGSLAGEQQSVMDIRLSREYMKGLEDDIADAAENQARWKAAAAEDGARRRAAAEAAEAVRARAAEAAWAAAAERRAAQEAELAAAVARGEVPPPAAIEQQQQEEEAPAAPEPPPTASGLPGVTPDELAAALKARQAVALDVRGAREAEWGKIKGCKHAPFISMGGSSLNPEVKPNPGFLDAAAAALGAPGACPPLVVLYGPGAALDSDTSASFVSKEQFVSVAPNGTATVDGQDIVAAAAAALQAAGYPPDRLAELAGGYRAWDLAYRPDGRRRAKGAFRDKSSGELEWWTASN